MANRNEIGSIRNNQLTSVFCCSKSKPQTMGCGPSETIRFTLELQPADADLIEQTVSVLQRRLEHYDVAAFSVEREGAQRIAVEARGVEDVDRLSHLLQQTGRLEFRRLPAAVYEGRRRGFERASDT